MKQRVSLLLSTDLVKMAKELTETQDLDLTDLVEKALLDYLPKEIVLKIEL